MTLNAEQSARLAALGAAARDVWGAGQLTYLAEWILNGSPEDDDREEIERIQRAVGEARQEGYESGLYEASMIVHDVSAPAETAILERLRIMQVPKNDEAPPSIGSHDPQDGGFPPEQG